MSMSYEEYLLLKIDCEALRNQLSDLEPRFVFDERVERSLVELRSVLNDFLVTIKTERIID